MRRLALFGLLVFLLGSRALAAPSVTIVDPFTANPVNVNQGMLQMQWPANASMSISGPVTVNGVVTDAVGSAGAVALIQCDKTARVSGQSASTILIAHVAGQTTYVCSYTFSVGLVVSISAGLNWGTGSACGTSTVPASPVLAVGLSILGGQLASLGGGLGAVDQSPVSGTSDYCLVTTGSPAATGIVRYAQF